MNFFVSLVWTVVQLRCNRCYLLVGPWIMLLMSCFSLPILLLHTYILLMYCLLFGLCIEMPSYAVYKGKVPGVYDDWEECRRQVHHFSGNSYKGYTTRAEAESRYARYLAGERRERWRNRMKTSFIAMMLIVMTAALFYVMVV